ncbi:MAG: ribbon-helix-helix protein, CopG family [Deltaproteobacteria bacterium]|nr:ribbon-helix-helix protein, CopG family [Deltaproteobacteria bacterium]
MIRTQIYLTEQQRVALNKLSSKSGKNQSELIRDAVDTLIAKLDKTNRQAVLSRVAGIWKDRADLPDIDKLRHTWDRNFPS